MQIDRNRQIDNFIGLNGIGIGLDRSIDGWMHGWIDR
jgi:hypothetical protein